MTPIDSATVETSLAETIREKLQTSSVPLNLNDVTKGIRRPKKVTAADFKAEIRKILEEEVRLGRVFSHPSGKQNQVRYWVRDEKQFLRNRAMEAAAVPHPLSALKTKLGKEIKGVEGAFVENVVRELISEDQLFEHPPKTKKSGPLFGTSPPPPALSNQNTRKSLTSSARNFAN